MDEDKLFTCDVCKKFFKLKTNMIKHKSIHAGGKPFKCDLCEKTFLYKHVLADHKEYIQGKNLMYVIDVISHFLREVY